MISFLSIKEWVCVDDCKEYIQNHNITCDLTSLNHKSPLQRFYDPVTKDYYIAKEGILEIDPNAFFLVTDAYEVLGGSVRRGLNGRN